MKIKWFLFGVASTIGMIILNRKHQAFIEEESKKAFGTLLTLNGFTKEGQPKFKSK